MVNELITKTVLFGMGGAIVGSLHAAVNFVSDTPAAVVTLCTTYDHLQEDDLLAQVLCEINEDFKEIDHVAAVRTIHAIDKLVGLRMSLERGEREPNVADRITGMVSFTKAKEAIQRFISRAEITKTPRRVIYLQRHAQVIMRQLDTHLQAIIMSTRDMYMHP
jgi:hypothetical protein